MRSEASILKERTGGNVERLGEVEQSLIEQPSLAVLDGDQDIACDARAQGQCLLGEPLLDTQSADPGADIESPLRPDLGPLRIGLAGAGGHLSTNRANTADVCPTSDTFCPDRTQPDGLVGRRSLAGE